MFDCRTNRTIGFDWVRLVFGSVLFDWLRRDNDETLSVTSKELAGKCNRCNLQYIGETKRRLKDRLNEHHRTI